MRVKYRCPIVGMLRVEREFPLPGERFHYQIELGKYGELTHVTATARVPDKSQWPKLRPSNDPKIKLQISVQRPFFDDIKRDLRAAEGLLSLFGLESIDTESAEQTWCPDNEEEESALELFSFSMKRERRPINEVEPLAFDLVARAFLAAPRARECEVSLSFFRKGRRDVIEQRYIEAVFDFFFMLETLYAQGKFKVVQVEQSFLRNDGLMKHVQEALHAPALHHNVLANPAVAKSFAQDYADKSPQEIVRHIVRLRGFLHHHSQGRLDAWHPEDHVRFGADAYVLQQICGAVAFKLAHPHLYATEVVRAYVEIAEEVNRKSYMTVNPAGTTPSSNRT